MIFPMLFPDHGSSTKSPERLQRSKDFLFWSRVFIPLISAALPRSRLSVGVSIFSKSTQEGVREEFGRERRGKSQGVDRQGGVRRQRSPGVVLVEEISSHEATLLRG